MDGIGLTLDEVDEAVEAQGDNHTINVYYSYIRPRLEYCLDEKTALIKYGDLDHLRANEE